MNPNKTLALMLGLAIASFSPGCSKSGGGASGPDFSSGQPPAGGTFGLETRVEVSTLQFGTIAPDPGALRRVDAFPALTFQSPVFLTTPGDGTDRICVVERGGRIRIFANSGAVTGSAVFLDIRTRVQAGGEEGLLGLAFDPDHATNGFFYVDYTAGSPRRSVLARYRVSAGDPDQADPASGRVLLEVSQPFSNHNGGMLAFGPDLHLYLSLGDGGNGGDPFNHGQNLATLLGSILRIRPLPDGTYAVPGDNPFVGAAGGARPEIWAYGLRNPWRFSFDRLTGDLWVGDVGQGAREEISVARAGDNLGWRVYEGTLPFANPTNRPPEDFTPPVIDYSRSQGTAVIGGYVYRGDQLRSLQGAYFYGDNGSGKVWALQHVGLFPVSNVHVATVSNLSAFGEDEAGELYAVSLGGKIFRFEEADTGAAQFPRMLSETGLFKNTVDLLPEDGVIEYDIAHPHWVDGATMRRWIALPGVARIEFHPTEAWEFPLGTVLVKHFEVETRTGDPTSLRRLETRVLLRDVAGWQGRVYRWNAAGIDAELLADALTEDVVIDDAGGPRSQEWYYPSPGDCLRCHSEAAGSVLGLRTRQLNRDYAYPLRVDNQLRAWNHIGLFMTDIGEASDYEVLPARDDASVTVASRARAYLEVNCAHCHQPNGTAPDDIDLRLDTATADMAVVDVVPTAGDLGLTASRRVRSGIKESSVLWERMRRSDTTRMPPLATSVVDEGVELIGQWIDALGGS